MSPQTVASDNGKPHGSLHVLILSFVLHSALAGSCTALAQEGGTVGAAQPEPLQMAQGGLPSVSGGGPVVPQGPFEPLIARVVVNTVNKGDAALLRDAHGLLLAPARELSQWGVKLGDAARVTIVGESYVVLARLPDVEVAFDEKTVTLELKAAAKTLPESTIDLAWQRRRDVIFPADSSIIFNYGLSAQGDETFGSPRYQAATEFAARTGSWLFFNTTTFQRGTGVDHGVTRLVTNAQYDDRANLRRAIVGDFFTPGLETTSSVPMGGLSFAKVYQMDPYYVQYPTAGFTTQVTLPSTVDVRIDGNLVAQRQVQPGPLDITNVTGAAGQRNVTVTIRDPFGREQVLGQPFYFSQFGLAKGLQEYSYNLGFLREQYGVSSNEYGPLAGAAYHRYAFTDEITLGLRGEATDKLANLGPFGSILLPSMGILGLGASGSLKDGASGYSGAASYGYGRGPFYLSLASRYFSKEYGRLADAFTEVRPRLDGYATASVFFPQIGSLSAGYSTVRSYTTPDSTFWNLGYNRSLWNGKAILSVNYTHNEQPSSDHVWSLSFTYYLDRDYAAVGRVGGSRNANAESIALQKIVPRGEGFGFNVEAGRAEREGTTAAVGRGSLQVNATHATFGMDYARASEQGVAPGFSRAFVAGSVDYAGNTIIAARPILDSFAVVKVGDLPDVPVFANNWLMGRTDAEGKVVATDLYAYYDNYISFGAKNLPVNYQFPASVRVISPLPRSGSLLSFPVRKSQAVYGRLVEERDGRELPIELRELKITRNGQSVDSFTARRGEFFLENSTLEYILF